MKVPEYAAANYADTVVSRYLTVGILMVTMCIASVTWAWADGDTAQIPAPIRAIAASKDGKLAVTGDDASLIRVWDLKERTLKRIIDVIGPHRHTFPCYAISADGKHALVGHSDGFLRLGKDVPQLAPRDTLTLWDLTSGQKIRAFDNKGERVGYMALSPDGKLALASGGVEVKVIRNGDAGFPVGVATLRLWEVSTGRLIHTLLDRTLECGGGHAFSADGKLCAVGGGFGQRLLRVQQQMPGWDVKIWDTATGKEVGSMPTARGSEGVTCLAFSPDSAHVATGVGHRTVRLWDRVTGKAMWTWTDAAHGRTATCVTFSPDGKSVLACGPETNFSRRIPKAAEPGRLVMIDVATGKERMAFAGTKQWIASCAYTPDGRHVLAAAALGTQFVDAARGDLMFLLRN
jgi:WD40 repeat protein